MTPEQSALYMRKSGDTAIETDGLIENEHGFMSCKVLNETLVAYQVFGDGEYWNGQLNEMAKDLGLRRIRMATIRNPKAFERKFGFKLIGYILEKEVA